MARRMRAAAITNYAETAAELGLDPAAMLRSLDIDRRVLSDTEIRFPADKVFQLLETTAQRSGCETFGLRMGMRRKLPDYGPISLVLAHQPTLRDALETMVRYQRMLNEALLYYIEDADDHVAFREELISTAGVSLRQAYELAVCSLLQTFGGPTGPVLRPVSVHFAHGPPEDLELHHRCFGRNIEFNSTFNGIVCTRAAMDAPNALADPGLAAHAERYLKSLPYAGEVSVTAEVQRLIHQLLPFNGASMTSVGAKLGVSERTLQRRLEQEGAEFSDLLNDIRRDQAVRYLSASRAPMAEIAGLLGYSRETSFGRWFAAEFGAPPSAWRAAHR